MWRIWFRAPHLGSELPAASVHEERDKRCRQNVLRAEWRKRALRRTTLRRGAWWRVTRAGFDDHQSDRQPIRRLRSPIPVDCSSLRLGRRGSHYEGRGVRVRSCVEIELVHRWDCRCELTTDHMRLRLLIPGA